MPQRQPRAMNLIGWLHVNVKFDITMTIHNFGRCLNFTITLYTYTIYAMTANMVPNNNNNNQFSFHLHFRTCMWLNGRGSSVFFWDTNHNYTIYCIRCYNRNCVLQFLCHSAHQTCGTFLMVVLHIQVIQYNRFIALQLNGKTTLWSSSIGDILMVNMAAGNKQAPLVVLMSDQHNSVRTFASIGFACARGNLWNL